MGYPSIVAALEPDPESPMGPCSHCGSQYHWRPDCPERATDRLEAQEMAVVPDEMPETILEEAARITSGNRNRDYGHPIENHTCTAELWRTWLRRRHGVDIPLTAEDVCWLNVLQKLSREANFPKRDNAVDVCGFTRNVEMIRERRERSA